MGGGNIKSNCSCFNTTKISIIKISKQNRIFYKKVDKYPELETKSCISRENIFKIYTFIRFIDKGSFSRVKLAYKNIDGESIKYAIKIVNKKGISILVRNSIINELTILATLDHPNIVKIYEIYENEHNYYIVMEYLEGGTLLKLSEIIIYNPNNFSNYVNIISKLFHL